MNRNVIPAKCVVPAEAGTQHWIPACAGMTHWIPACAGMTHWIPACTGMTFRAGTTLLLALAVTSAAWAQPLYKCRQPDGRIVYQGEKCAPGAAQSEVAPPPRPASTATPPPEEPPPATPQDLEKVVGILAAFERCATYVPGFAARHEAAFRQWKTKNLAAMVQYSQDGAAQKKVRDSTEYSRKQARLASAEERTYQAQVCDEQVAASLKNP